MYRHEPKESDLLVYRHAPKQSDLDVHRHEPKKSHSLPHSLVTTFTRYHIQKEYNLRHSKRMQSTTFKKNVIYDIRKQ